MDKFMLEELGTMLEKDAVEQEICTCLIERAGI